MTKVQKVLVNIENSEKGFMNIIPVDCSPELGSFSKS